MDLHEMERQWRPYLIGIACLVAGCATTPPNNTDNLCDIFGEKPAWFHGAERASERWGAPIALQMAILRHESDYRSDVRPPRPYLLGFIPWFRSSSAYGYAQAQDGTWEWYMRSAGAGGADRDDFDDAVDFVGWYIAQSRRLLGIPATDAFRHYLAYHEGHGGYRRGTYQQKAWLVRYARRVAATTQRYARQLQQCGPSLRASGGGWWPF